MTLQFAQPFYFLLLLPLAFLMWTHWKKKLIQPVLILPNISQKAFLKSKKMQWAKYVDWALPVGVLFGIVALSRPQLPDKEELIKTNGVDIIMAIDVSLSMLAQDFKPNRLEIAKQMAADFITKRAYDRIGVIAFSGEAITKCPLTTDKKALIETVKTLKNGDLAQGTAIGTALATAVNRLKSSAAKSKVIVLMTDGTEDSDAYIKPLMAIELAKTHNIRLYTIGIGTNGLAYMPYGISETGDYVYGMQPVVIDEALLTRLADLSNGGRYFRARNEAELEQIYTDIDTLEKVTLDAKSINQKTEFFYPFLIVAMVCFSLYFLLNQSILKTFP